MRDISFKVLNLKGIVVVTTWAIIILLIVIRHNYDYSASSSIRYSTAANSDSQAVSNKAPNCTDDDQRMSCNKIPASLAQAIVHYTTSKITPQQTFKEISVSASVLELKSPCNFLVFGLGHDSLMWNALNYGGRTVFLDEDETWIKQISGRFPILESYKVTYSTKLSQADKFMKLGLTTDACKEVSHPRQSSCQLVLKGLPSEVYDTKWDLIMVDAPTGFHEETPGRMTAIYTAGLIARNREDGVTDVFVHDVDRHVEDQFSMAFLCEGYLQKQEGRIRHFRIPSHRDDLERPFCPLLNN